MNRKLVSLLCASVALCVLAGMPRSSSQAAITMGNHANASASLDQRNPGTDIASGIPLEAHPALVHVTVPASFFGYDGPEGGKKPRIPQKPRSVAPGTNVSFSTIPVLDDRISFASSYPDQNAYDNKGVGLVANQREVIPNLSVLKRSMPPTYRASVTEQPDGEVFYYRRSGKALWNHYDESDIVAQYGEQSGYMKVVTNGNDVWFENLIYDPEGLYTESLWVKGTKTGSAVSISLPVDYDDISYASYGVDVSLVWGSTRIQNGVPKWTRNFQVNTAYFDIDADGVMTLRNANSSSQWTGNGLCAAYQYGSRWYFDYSMLYQTTLTPAGEIPGAPVMYTDDDIDAMSGEFVEYNRTGYAWFPEQNILGRTVLNLNEQEGAGYIFYDEDGTTVYMRDPVYGWSNGMWVKGTKDGNQLTFPLGQYLYWDEDFFGMRTVWGTMVVSGDNYLYFTEAPDVTEVTFTIDGDRLTMNGCGMPDENSYAGLALMIDSAYYDLGWFGDLDFWTNYYDIPATPTNVTVEPGMTTANVGWSDEDNSKWNVRYRERVDTSFIDYYVCDFEDTTAVNKWWVLDWDMDNHRWIHCRSPRDGNNYLASASYINYVGPLNPDNWLISPEIRLDGIVKFNSWGADAEWGDEIFKVYLFVGDSAAIMDEYDFVAISGDVTTTSEKTEYTFSIPDEYKNQMGYVAIRHYNVSDEYWLCLDDFYVGNPDVVPQWNYVYGVEQPSILLEGLTPETIYEMQVQGVNGGGAGSWADITHFFTTIDPPYPNAKRGDIDGNGVVGMDDLTTLINYLVGIIGPDDIHFENAAVCDSMTGTPSESVGMDDLTALINYLVYNHWDN